MSIDKHTLGAAIKQVRSVRGLTQTELAEAAGLSRSGNSIALIEQGRRFVSVDTLNALATALDIPPACLAVLGSRPVGKNKAAAAFMESLQNLISTVILAETTIRIDKNGERAMGKLVKRERRGLTDLAVTIKGLAKKGRSTEHLAAAKKSAKAPATGKRKAIAASK